MYNRVYRFKPQKRSLGVTNIALAVIMMTVKIVEVDESGLNGEMNTKFQAGRDPTFRNGQRRQNLQ